MRERDVVAVIPARGNSKRLPGKNLKKLANKPLLYWSVDCAKAAGIKRILVSTEDAAIKQHAIDAGCEVHDRRRELADDYVSATTVILDAISEQKASRFVVLLPTWPFRLSRHVLGMVDFSPAGTPYDRLVTVSRLRAADECRLHLNTASGRPSSHSAWVVDSYVSVLTAKELTTPGGDFPVEFHGRGEAQHLDIDTPAQFAMAEWFAADDRRWRAD